MGATRYGDFAVATADLELGAVEPPAIADRRRAAGTRVPTRRIRSRSEYLTTPRSRSLWPMLVSIWDWERPWVPDHTERSALDAPHRLRRRLRPAGDLPRVRRSGQRERRCRAVGSERILVAVDAAAATRRRSGDRARPGLFPQTMSVLGNRWAFAILVAAFVGRQPVHRLPDPARRAAGIDRRPAVDLRRERRAGRRGRAAIG